MIVTKLKSSSPSLTSADTTGSLIPFFFYFVRLETDCRLAEDGGAEAAREAAARGAGVDRQQARRARPPPGHAREGVRQPISIQFARRPLSFFVSLTFVDDPKRPGEGVSTTTGATRRRPTRTHFENATHTHTHKKTRTDYG